SRPPDCFVMTALITFRSTPGIVTNAPIRKTASIASVNSTRRRSSGTLLMFANPASTLIGGRSLRRRRGLRDEDGLAAGLRDLLLSALREGVRGNRELLRQVAVAEDLDAIGVALDEAVLAECTLVDVGTGVEAVELAHVDFGDDGLIVLR